MGIGLLVLLGAYVRFRVQLYRKATMTLPHKGDRIYYAQHAAIWDGQQLPGNKPISSEEAAGTSSVRARLDERRAQQAAAANDESFFAWLTSGGGSSGRRSGGGSSNDPTRNLLGIQAKTASTDTDGTLSSSRCVIWL